MQDTEQIKTRLAKQGYEYKQFIGKGGFSSVLLCHSKKYDQNFAIKRSIKHKLTDYEYNNLISLDHPNIIKLYDAFSDPLAQYLVMEYCPYGTLQQKGRLSYDKFIYYAKQILEAVAFCHSKSIAHRDIKPDNIFLDKYDNIKLADFGMAKKFNYDDKSKEKCGSLMFVPPEFFLNDEISPFKADIWSLGITFFVMATGNYPYTSRNYEELKKIISSGQIDFFEYQMNPNIILLISKMTEKNPLNRPSAEKLLEMPIFLNVPKKIVTNNGHAKKFRIIENCKNNSDLSQSQNHQLDLFSYRKIYLNPKIAKINHIHPYQHISK